MTGVTSMPRIIGGRDLVPHQYFNTSRSEAWFTQHPEASQSIQEERQRQQEMVEEERAGMGFANESRAVASTAGFSMPATGVRRRRDKRN